MIVSPQDEKFDEPETVRRRDDALKRMLSTPPQPKRKSVGKNAAKPVSRRRRAKPKSSEDA